MSSGPRLFSPTGAAEIDPGDGPGVDTPLGRVVFAVHVDGELLAPSAAWQTGPYMVWRFGEHVECLLNPRLAVELLPGMAVDGAAAVVWRRGTAGEASVECLFADGARFTDDTSDNGDGLCARTFTGGGRKLTVGAPWPPGEVVFPSGDSFLPEWIPPAGQQTHVACAWGPDDPDDPSTWFTVDRTPDELLAFE